MQNGGGDPRRMGRTGGVQLVEPHDLMHRNIIANSHHGTAGLILHQKIQIGEVGFDPVWDVALDGQLDLDAMRSGLRDIDRLERCAGRCQFVLDVLLDLFHEAFFQENLLRHRATDLGDAAVGAGGGAGGGH